MLNRCLYVKIQKHYKYILVDDYIQILPCIFDKDYNISTYITVTKKGYLKISRGYAWDGPSGPTIDTKSFMTSSLVHDVLYQLMREGGLDIRYRKTADELLRDMSIDDGMLPFRAWVVYICVRLFSRFAVKPKKSHNLVGA